MRRQPKALCFRLGVLPLISTLSVVAQARSATSRPEYSLKTNPQPVILFVQPDGVQEAT
jgi:hypothetical protein